MVTFRGSLYPYRVELPAVPSERAGERWGYRPRVSNCRHLPQVRSSAHLWVTGGRFAPRYSVIIDYLIVLIASAVALSICATGRVRDEYSVLKPTLGRSGGVPRRLATSITASGQLW